MAAFDALARAGGLSEQVLIDSSAVKAHRSAFGGKGGDNPGHRPIARRSDNENPCRTDTACRPIDFMLTGGQVPDCVAGEALIERMPDARRLNGDKVYASHAIRRRVEARGAMANIRPKAKRRWKNFFSPVLYLTRNAMERMFCRLKNFRRVATRYDRLAVNFLATVCIAAIVSYWL